MFKTVFRILLTEMKDTVRLEIDIVKLKYCTNRANDVLLIPKTLKMKLERPS